MQVLHQYMHNFTENVIVVSKRQAQWSVDAGQVSPLMLITVQISILKQSWMLQDLAEIFQLLWPDSFLQSSVLAVHAARHDKSLISYLFRFLDSELRL